MTKWSRWQDWLILVAGAYLALSPIWVATTGAAVATVIVLGVLLAITALWSLAAPGAVGSEWTHVGLGGLTFIAPWLIGFSDLSGASWTSWVAGAVATILGLTAVTASQQVHASHIGHAHPVA